jgi:acyl-CoA reductase-like NAD-dependent aldehyde dehydrogenase
VFADVTNDVTFARQEIFGLVLVASPSTTMPTPIAMANDSNFGLGSAIWRRGL